MLTLFGFVLLSFCRPSSHWACCRSLFPSSQTILTSLSQQWELFSLPLPITFMVSHDFFSMFSVLPISMSHLFIIMIVVVPPLFLTLDEFSVDLGIQMRGGGQEQGQLLHESTVKKVKRNFEVYLQKFKIINIFKLLTLGKCLRHRKTTHNHTRKEKPRFCLFLRTSTVQEDLRE